MQHVSGPTHLKGHTLDLFFSHGLTVDNLHMEDSLISDHSCISFDMANVEKFPSCNGQGRKHFISQPVVENFIYLFDAEPVSNSNDDDVNSLVQSFNLRCKSPLDKVVLVKLRSIALRKPCPWINEEIKNHRTEKTHNSRKTEQLWKTSKFEVHRLYLKDRRLALNNLMKSATAAYFAQLISFNKRNPKFLFDTIGSTISPEVPATTASSTTDCNAFANFIVEKVNDIRANCVQTVSNTCTSLPPRCKWPLFSLVSLSDISALLTTMTPSCSPLDILPKSLLLKTFGSTGPCITEILNQSLQSNKRW